LHLPWHMNSLPGPPILPPHSGQTQFKMLEIRSALVRSVVNSMFSIIPRGTMKCQPSVIRGRRGDASRLLSTFELTEACCTCACALSIPQGFVTNHRGLHDSVAAKEARNGLCRSKVFLETAFGQTVSNTIRESADRHEDVVPTPLRALQSQADRSESHTAFTRQRPFSTDSAGVPGSEVAFEGL
jgi:hypothetical protein